MTARKTSHRSKRAPRVYLDAPLALGRRIRLPAGQSQHLIGVLRLRPEAAISLFNGDGRDYGGRIVDADRSSAQVEIETISDPEPAPPIHVRVALGVAKGERFDFALQKVVELGAAEIVPLFTERSMVRLDGERLRRRQYHWSGVVLAACEQSGRRRLPHLVEATRLPDWLPRHHPGALLLSPDAELRLPDLSPAPSEVTLLVGPEGGLTDSERAAARGNGFTAVRLGPRILRTETAPIAAVAAVQALWGDFRS